MIEAAMAQFSDAERVVISTYLCEHAGKSGRPVGARAWR
jgi:hypothetical protein